MWMRQYGDGAASRTRTAPQIARVRRREVPADAVFHRGLFAVLPRHSTTLDNGSMIRRSPLARLMKEGTGGLRPAAEIPASEASSTEAARLAFCPELFAHTHRGLCGHVDCGACQFVPEGRGWLCSTCAKTEPTLAYYADGPCTLCGEESPVLTLWRS